MENQIRKQLEGITVSEAIRLHNQDVVVKGMIVSISQPFKMITERIILCSNETCSNRFKIDIFDKPKFSVNEKRYSFLCPNCNNDEVTVQYDYENTVAAIGCPSFLVSLLKIFVLGSLSRSKAIWKYKKITSEPDAGT